MRRLSVTLLVLATALVAAAPAAAKELMTVRVCGAAGCVDRSDRLTAADRGHALLGVGGVVDDPGRAPYVVLELGIGDGRDRIFGYDTLRFVPSVGVARTTYDGAWHALRPTVLAGYRRLAAGIGPVRARTAAVQDDVPALQSAGRPRATFVREEEEGAGPAPAAIAAIVVAGLAAAGVAAAYGRRRRRRPGPARRPAAG